jgi:hypothetical protein
MSTGRSLFLVHFHWTAKLPRMGEPSSLASIHLPLEEVTVHVDLKVLVDVDDNMAQIVSNLQGILGLILSTN